MSLLLQRAERLLQELPQSQIHPASVERAEWDASGLFILASSAQVASWYYFKDDVLTEVRPESDSQLPLAAELTAENRDTAVELLAYRPGRRLVLKRSVGGVSSILKGYRRRHSSDPASRYRLAQSIAGPDAFRTPSVLEHRVQDESLELEHLRGERLTVSEASAGQFFSIGVALRAFQRAIPDRELQMFASENELAGLDRLARRSASIVGLPGVWRELRAKLDRARSTLPSLQLGLTHRDLHDGQFLCTEEGLALLDFDLLCHADVTLDAANLLAHLRLRALQGIRGADEAGALACGEALLDGLDRSREPGFWERLRFYEATSFFRLALLYSHRPRWSKLRGDLLELGRRCLEEIL